MLDKFSCFFFVCRISYVLLTVLLTTTKYYAFAAIYSEVHCESMADHWWNYAGNQKTCFMTKTSVIVSNGYKISPLNVEGVTAISFKRNHKIFHLPEKVHEVFPNLTAYSASSCSIKTISKHNFENLNRLLVLWLYGNSIETISSNVFTDLTSLEAVDLSELTVGRTLFII